MYKLLIPIFIFLSVNKAIGQNNDYSANWKRIAGFEKKGLTQSALEEARKIFSLAVAQHNEPQQIKSAMFQMKYRNLVEEDNAQLNLMFLDTLTKRATGPAKNILHSMQAEAYWAYQRSQRFRLYDRTALAEEKSDDITTWSNEKLHRTITDYYKKSLENKTVLQNTPITKFDEILDEGKNTRHLRPTLYDFLAHQALEYFTSTERDITKPAYSFIIKDPKAFAPAAEFSNSLFAASDSTSLYYNAILIYQDLLKFHLSNKNDDALIDADIKRIQFIYDHGIFTKKDSLYLDALETLQKNHSDNPLVAQAGYLRALLLNSSAESAKADTSGKIKAKKIAEEMIRLYPNSEGGINSRNLIISILQPQLILETEKVNLPDQPFRNFIQYKNVEQIHFRIIPVSREYLNTLWGKSENEVWASILKQRPQKTFSIKLPKEEDFRLHSVEVKMEPLASGMYLVIGSIDKGFQMNKNILSRQVVHISTLAMIGRNSSEYFVLHRETGEPLHGAEIQTWQKNYDYQTRKFNYIQREKYFSGKDGSFMLKKTKDYRELNFEIIYKGEKLFLEDEFGTGYYNDFEPKRTKQLFLFTDRALYRPGQPVYFKGILLSRDPKLKTTDLVTNEKTEIALYDANGTKLSTRQVQTNLYGSFNGQFDLPEGLMNGIFTIRDSSNILYHTISVEEYKRPKFLVEIAKPQGTYRLNDTVTVNGNAKAYAGNAIAGAKVTYRVTRKVRYPFWWHYKIFPPQNNETMEITYGETETNDKGDFSFDFTAIPDEATDKKSQPIFTYRVIADVTDLSGETRTATMNIEVGYQALHINIEAPEKMPADSLSKIRFTTTNTAGGFEKALIKVELFSLNDMGSQFRERYWEVPDRHIYTREEFHKMFPLDPYADENNREKWSVKELVYSKSDSTSASGKWNWEGKKLKGGWYKFIATGMDRYGEPVKLESYIYLIDESAPSTEEIQVVTSQKTAEPGDVFLYSVKTRFDKIYMIELLERMEDRIEKQQYELSSQRPFAGQIKVSEKDRGGISLGHAFIKNNRVYTNTENIIVPWSNKELEITFATFRDKVLPGTEEKWTINIKGNKGEKVAVEALVNMYDASLDQFKKHNWLNLQSLWPTLNNNTFWIKHGFSGEQGLLMQTLPSVYKSVPEKSYDSWADQEWIGYGYKYRYLEGRAAGLESVVVAGVARKPVAHKDVSVQYDALTENNKQDDKAGAPSPEEVEQAEDEVVIRKNMRETAFFFPSLATDKDGNVSFSFSAPEALTQWKLMAMAHSADLQSGYTERFITTLKPLMVQPNTPRFFREGDNVDFSVKVVNMSDTIMKGTAVLELTDAVSGKNVDGWCKNIFPSQHFSVEPGQSLALRFPLTIPVNFNSSIVYRVKAITSNGAFSDGEEAAVPVLSNRILVTETLLLNMRNENKKSFTFEKLLNAGNSGSLTHFGLTVEYTTNPAWYVVQALPYLMEYPYDCSEQTFNRYYANALAEDIVSHAPRIKQIFAKWQTTDTAVLLSNLQKNTELKSALLEETPWVLQAANEQQQKANIAVLFDIVKLAEEQTKTLTKLRALQTPNGGFSWFKDGPDDRFITQYIITGFGRLKQLGITATAQSEIDEIVNRAVGYLDKRIAEEFNNLLKTKTDLRKDNLSHFAIQYLYMRSFFPGLKLPGTSVKAHEYYKNQIAAHWVKKNRFMQAMIAVTLFRSNDKSTPRLILASLRQNAINHPELGTYWKDFSSGGYFWYQAHVESQAMIIAAFSEIEKDNRFIDDMKTWLLKNKQTNNWRTTKATADACYALLLNGSDWLGENKTVTIQLGNTTINSGEQQTEAGSGYFKKKIPGDQVQQGMGNILVEVKPEKSAGENGPTSWGSVYWQYFEEMDKVSSAVSPLMLKKHIFIQRNSDRGPVLEAINNNEGIKVGDRLVVRIEVKADRDMEYIHLKDLRASGTEPVDVLSGYKFSSGIGYYQSTRDASTNFFFSSIPRGSYVFEYTLFATHEGDFSSGIASIQCMYAPEFASHSEGMRISISEK